MTHDELLNRIYGFTPFLYSFQPLESLQNIGRAQNKTLYEIAKLHTPNPISLKHGDVFCNHCMCYYPCKTIKIIEEIFSEE